VRPLVALLGLAVPGARRGVSRHDEREDQGRDQWLIPARAPAQGRPDGEAKHAREVSTMNAKQQPREHDQSIWLDNTPRRIWKWALPKLRKRLRVPADADVVAADRSLESQVEVLGTVGVGNRVRDDAGDVDGSRASLDRDLAVDANPVAIAFDRAWLERQLRVALGVEEVERLASRGGH